MATGRPYSPIALFRLFMASPTRSPAVEEGPKTPPRETPVALSPTKLPEVPTPTLRAGEATRAAITTRLRSAVVVCGFLWLPNWLAWLAKHAAAVVEASSNPKEYVYLQDVLLLLAVAILLLRLSTPAMFNGHMTLNLLTVLASVMVRALDDIYDIYIASLTFDRLLCCQYQSCNGSGMNYSIASSTDYRVKGSYTPSGRPSCMRLH